MFFICILLIRDYVTKNEDALMQMTDGDQKPG